MGFIEVLTIALVVLKLAGIIEWSWLAVLLPELIAFVIYAIVICGCLFFDTRRWHK